MENNKKRKSTYVIMLVVMFILFLLAGKTGIKSSKEGVRRQYPVVDTTIQGTTYMATVVHVTIENPDLNKSETYEDFAENCPLVDISDIQEGKYNDSKVRVRFVVENFMDSSALLVSHFIDSIDSQYSHKPGIAPLNLDGMTIENAGYYSSRMKILQEERVYDLDVWYLDDDSYKFDKFIVGEIANKPLVSRTKEMNPGDVIECLVDITNNKINAYDCFAINYIENVDLSDVHERYQNNCLVFDYDTISREPTLYRGLSYSLTGKVFQIVEEEAINLEILLDTEDGIVYVELQEYGGFRGPRILENDQVTIYGEFGGIKKYQALIKENRVPLIKAALIKLED